MELKDTVEMMLSDDYKERFRAEYFQVENRIQGLVKMIDKYDNGTLEFPCTAVSIELVINQLMNMKRYSKYLVSRAEINDINLDFTLDKEAKSEELDTDSWGTIADRIEKLNREAKWTLEGETTNENL